MRILLTGGGTAGHVNPALAIAQTVKQNCPDAEFLFVGTEGGKEKALVDHAGIPFKSVEIQGIKRSPSFSNFKAVYLAVRSPYQRETVEILEQFRPDLVIGTGGYVCWPIMAAAARLGIPTAIHESNSKPGLAVQLLQWKMDRIWINFESTRKKLLARKSILRVGNPYRGEFGTLSKEAARKYLGIPANEIYVLAFGGSLGAEYVNEAVLNLMKETAEDSQNPRILLASGSRDYNACQAKFRELGLEQRSNCVLTEYIHDMPLQMAAADLVISRAGAMTLSELALMKKASILIPSPHVSANHQYHNAKNLSDANAAALVEESTLADGGLTRAVRDLLQNPKRLQDMEAAIADFASPNANQMIWEDILDLIKK